MTVLSGSQGSLRFNGVDIARARAWEMTISREALDTTALCVTDATAIYGRSEGRGSATVLYDPDDTGAVTMLNSIFTDDQPEDGVQFVLDADNGEVYVESAFVETVSPSVQVGAAHACRVTFRLSDTSQSIVITGPTEVTLNSTRLYLSTLLGVPPQTVTYEWTSMGATFIPDNTVQNPQVNFDTPGTTTLKVTATLEDLSTLEATIDVTVSADPIFFATRPRLPLLNPATDFSEVLYDEPRELVYYVWNIDPADASQTAIGITKMNKQGTVLATWKYVRTNGTDNLFTVLVGWGVRPSNGDLYLSFKSSAGDVDRLFHISGSTGAILQERGIGPYLGETALLFWGPIYFTSDDLYIYSVSTRYGSTGRDGIAVLSADDFTGSSAVYSFSPGPTGGEIGAVTQAPDGRHFILYTGTNISPGWGFYEIAADLGGDPINSVSVISTPYYTTDEPSSFSGVGWSSTGYFTIENITGGDKIVEYNATFDPVNAFRFSTTEGDNTFADPVTVGRGLGVLGGPITQSLSPNTGSSNGYTTASGQPNAFGKEPLGFALHSDNLLNSSRYLNFCQSASPLVNGKSGFAIGTDGWAFASKPQTSDTRTATVFYGATINANAGQYALEITDDDAAPSFTATLQIGDISSYAPTTTSEALPVKDPTDFAYTLTPVTQTAGVSNATIFSFIDATLEFTYETKTQLPT